MEAKDARFNRRIRFSAVVIVSQMLLIALSLSWGIYLIMIAMNGGVLSVENNPWILYGEILATCLIIQFALIVIGLEVYRMRAQRRDERRELRYSAMSDIPEKAATNPESSFVGSPLTAGDPDPLSVYKIDS